MSTPHNQSNDEEERKSLIYSKYFTSTGTTEPKSANGVMNWESFKKQYYALENTIKKQLDRFRQLMSDLSKLTLGYILLIIVVNEMSSSFFV